MAWHALFVCKATIEISEGDKIRVQEIHEGMVVKYKKWACQLLQLDEVVFGELPVYVKERFLITYDAKEKKFDQVSHGKSLWKKWHRIKKDILNRDNNTVKKAIAKMPNGALPSGTDFSIFLDRVTYELYLVKEDEKNSLKVRRMKSMMMKVLMMQAMMMQSTMMLVNLT